MADYLMNRGKLRPSVKDRIKQIFSPDYIMTFLILMRKYQYYRNAGGLKSKIYKYLYNRMSLRLGFSIDCGALGYGVVIPHYGTIVVGSGNSIGNYAVLHTATCISAKGITSGDGLYLSTGAKITQKVILGDFISIGANSVVNKDCVEGGCMLAGAPAHKIKQCEPWYIRDNWQSRVDVVETLRGQMGLNQ